jgi:DNA-binding NarL/FixJ family response regulator
VDGGRSNQGDSSHPDGRAESLEILLVQRCRPLLMHSLAALLREGWPGAVVGPLPWDEAVDRCAEQPPRLTLIEYSPPPGAENAAGLVDLLARLRTAAPFTRPVVLADEAEHQLEEVVMVDAARAGAVALVRTIDDGDACLATLRAAAAGVSPLPTEEVASLAERVDESRRRVREATHRIASLTKREREILDRLGSGLRNEQIARDLSISARTVEKHMQHILQKLAVDSRVRAVWMLAELRGTA